VVTNLLEKGRAKIALLEKVLQNLPTFWKKVEPNNL